MSTTPTQNSRYPRPLKATHLFQQRSSSPSFSSPTHPTSPSFLYPSSSSPFFKAQSETGITKKDSKSKARFSDCPETPQTASQIIQTDDPNGTRNLENGYHSTSLSSEMRSRRSNSLSSLSDSNLLVKDVDHFGNTFTHRRSSSLSSSSRTAFIEQQGNTRKHQNHNSHHQEDVNYSRFSIEGLNQEISAALEGKSLTYEHSHPDGHIAPVHDLVKGGITCISVTTPIGVHSSPPLSLPSSPLCVPPDDIASSSSGSLTLPESPMVMDLHSYVYPSSPKSSFDHRPPVGAEKCTSVQGKMYYPGNHIPKAPDSSKANIVFQGSVFSPLLPSHGIETVTIS